MLTVTVATHSETRTRTGDIRPWLAVASLAWRELIRFFRQPTRVIGAIGQPVLFWIFFGVGFGPTFRMPGAASDVSYFQYYFPGTLVLILLFTAIFTTISIIEDRREGFLQSVLVAPIPRWAMVLGKILGGSLIAVAQGMLFLLLGFTLDVPFSPLQFLVVTVFMTVIAIAQTSVGFVFAWQLDSTQGFHAIMSVVLIPMWLLSGAFFPAGDNWLGWVIRLNPLTYAVAGLRRLLYWEPGATVHQSVTEGLPSLTLCVVVTILFAVVSFVLAWLIAGRTTRGDLLS